MCGVSCELNFSLKKSLSWSQVCQTSICSQLIKLTLRADYKLTGCGIWQISSSQSQEWKCTVNSQFSRKVHLTLLPFDQCSLLQHTLSLPQFHKLIHQPHQFGATTSYPPRDLLLPRYCWSCRYSQRFACKILRRRSSFLRCYKSLSSRLESLRSVGCKTKSLQSLERWERVGQLLLLESLVILLFLSSWTESQVTRDLFFTLCRSSLSEGLRSLGTKFEIGGRLIYFCTLLNLLQFQRGSLSLSFVSFKGTFMVPSRPVCSLFVTNLGMLPWLSKSSIYGLSQALTRIMEPMKSLSSELQRLGMRQVTPFLIFLERSSMEEDIKGGLRAHIQQRMQPSDQRSDLKLQGWSLQISGLAQQGVPV